MGASYSRIKTKSGDSFKYVYYIVDSKMENKKVTVFYKKSTGSDKEAVAKKELALYLKSKEENTGLTQDVLFSQLLSDFLRVHKGAKTKSLEAYRTAANRFIGVLGDRKLAEYGVRAIDNYFADMRDTHSPTTIHHHRRQLTTIFDLGIKYRYIRFSDIHITEYIAPAKPPVIFYSREQFIILIHAIDEYAPRDARKDFLTPAHKQFHKDIYTFAYLTGLRREELIQLKPSQIDIERRMIRILQFKTGAIKNIEMHDDLVPIYHRYKHQEFLFQGVLSGKVLYADGVSRMLKKYNKAAGLPSELTFKSLRSGFGMLLLNTDQDLKFVSTMLGHSTVKTTEKHYANYLQSDNTGRVNKIQVHQSEMNVVKAG